VSFDNLDDCLPEDLRGPGTTITRISAGFSGAGVYRVEAAGQSYVLKVSDASKPLVQWRRQLGIQQLAANAGLAAPVLHAVEARRAVVSAFVLDRSFPAFYGDARTREAAVVLLGRTLRRVHELALPADAETRDSREFLAALTSGLVNFPVPSFVEDAVVRVLTEEPPDRERPMVLSHNDVNPGNLAYDGERLLLLDWETAGPNDPFYDLATISVFARMDDETCQQLLAAYDAEPISALPERFAYLRRLIGVLCGVMFLNLARRSGHTGASGAETLDSTPSLIEFYQRMRAGEVNPATGDGQWLFGLSLIKNSFAL
jgi:aminoglycoside phosphotransferase (APT) family kinase protein